MIQRISHITVMCRDQNEALEWYSQKLGFVVRRDEPFGEGERFLTVAPPEQEDIEVVLFQAKSQPQLLEVGRGAMWVMRCDDCMKTYEELTNKGVQFRSEPQPLPWGISAIFQDLYGNYYNLVEPTPGQ